MMATSSCNTIVSSSQGDADDLTTLSLLKLSYATTPDLHVKPLYTHLPPRDDIFAVFDRVSSKNFEGIVVKNQRMKIIIGSNTLVCPKASYLSDNACTKVSLLLLVSDLPRKTSTSKTWLTSHRLMSKEMGAHNCLVRAGVYL